VRHTRPATRAAVAEAVAAADGLDLVGTGRTFAAAIDLLPRVDVLVCDVQLDGHAEGLRVVEVARHVATPPAVLLLSGFGHQSVVRAAIDRGAAGYLDKGAEVAAIVDAIRTGAG